MFKVPAMSDPGLWVKMENIQAVPPLICVHSKVKAPW